MAKFPIDAKLDFADDSASSPSPPADFAKRFAWKNDLEKATLLKLVD